MKQDENGYYVDEACDTKWKDKPPDWGVGFRVIEERMEGGIRIIEKFELMEVSVAK